MSQLIFQIAGVMVSLHDGVDARDPAKRFMPEEKAKEKFYEIVLTGSIYRGILMTVYGLLSKEKAITEIEMLSDDEKEKIKSRARDVLNGRKVDGKVLMELYKAIHTMDLISQQ